MRKLFSTLVTLLCSMCLLAQSNDAPVLTIIHTNDTHSQIEPAVNRKGVAQGGVVERASLLEYFRQQDPDLLYLDAGDMIQGTPYFNIFDGEVEMLCMNQQQLVASTLGNHEFDNGLPFLADMLRKAQFPMICCNYHCEGTPLQNLIVPYMTLYNHGVKIGITGVTVSPQDLIFARNWAGITFEDPCTAVNREVETMRSEGCDLVIVLSHLGYLAAPQPGHKGTLDSDLVAGCRGIDVVIGAHTHVNIEHGVYFTDPDGRQVLVTQTGAKQAPIGYLQITMKRGSTYPGCHYSVDSIVCSKLHPEDYDLTGLGKEMAETIAPYQEVYRAKMNVRLASCPQGLHRGKPQSTLGNFTSDAFREIGEQLTGRKMDVSVMNNGGLRADLPAGDVTLGNLFSIFPFENTVTILDLKGSDLKRLIESNAGRKLDAWSGTQITLEMEGDRCIASKILVGGEPIDEERIYTMCTIDFLAEGNSGMTALTHAVKSQNTGILIRDAMIDYVKALDAQGKVIEPVVDDRVIDKTPRREPRGPME